MEDDCEAEIAALKTPMHLIVDRLFLGNIRAAQDEQLLQSHNVTCIVQCLEDSSLVPAFPFAEYCTVPVSDIDSQNIAAFLPKAVHFIHACRQAGKTVLVHCAAGISRSSTVVVAYLMAAAHMDCDEALAFVRGRRRCASPNPGFWQQLQHLDLAQLRNELV